MWLHTETRTPKIWYDLARCCNPIAHSIAVGFDHDLSTSYTSNCAFDLISKTTVWVGLARLLCCMKEVESSSHYFHSTKNCSLIFATYAASVSKYCHCQQIIWFLRYYLLSSNELLPKTACQGAKALNNEHQYWQRLYLSPLTLEL